MNDRCCARLEQRRSSCSGQLSSALSRGVPAESINDVGEFLDVSLAGLLATHGLELVVDGEQRMPKSALHGGIVALLNDSLGFASMVLRVSCVFVGHGGQNRKVGVEL